MKLKKQKLSRLPRSGSHSGSVMDHSSGTNLRDDVDCTVIKNEHTHTHTHVCIELALVSGCIDLDG